MVCNRPCSLHARSAHLRVLGEQVSEVAPCSDRPNHRCCTGRLRPPPPRLRLPRPVRDLLREHARRPARQGGAAASPRGRTPRLAAFVPHSFAVPHGLTPGAPRSGYAGLSAPALALPASIWIASVVSRELHLSEAKCRARRMAPHVPLAAGRSASHVSPMFTWRLLNAVSVRLRRRTLRSTAIRRHPDHFAQCRTGAVWLQLEMPRHLLVCRQGPA